MGPFLLSFSFPSNNLTRAFKKSMKSTYTKSVHENNSAARRINHAEEFLLPKKETKDLRESYLLTWQISQPFSLWRVLSKWLKGKGNRKVRSLIPTCVLTTQITGRGELACRVDPSH